MSELMDNRKGANEIRRKACRTTLTSLRRRSYRLSTIMHTKDRVVIYKVFLKNIPPALTCRKLYEHFSTYGTIKSIQLGPVLRPNDGTDNACKIVFSHPQAAAAVLRDRFLVFDRVRYAMHACPDWEQPYRTPYHDQVSHHIDVLSSQANEKRMSLESHIEGVSDVVTDTSLLMLNDDCLTAIFTCLDLSSQLNLAICCERLQNIFTNLVCPITRRYRNLDLDTVCCGNLKDWEIYQFFKLAGHVVESLEISSNVWLYNSSNYRNSSVNVITLIQEHCINLQRLQIIKHRRIIEPIHNFPFQRHFITELELYNCNLVDSDLDTIIGMVNIVSLGLGKNHQIRGQPLIELRKLKRLSLYYCYNISKELISYLCVERQLTFLDIRFACNNNANRDITFSNALRVLKISHLTWNECERLLNLPNIEALDVEQFNLPANFCTRLLYSYGGTLRFLKIIGICHYLWPNVISNFHMLRVLWLSQNSHYVGYKTLEIVANLKFLEELYVESSLELRSSDILTVIDKCEKLKILCIYSSPRIKYNLIMSAYRILYDRHQRCAPQTREIRRLSIYLSKCGINPIMQLSDSYTKIYSKYINMKFFEDLPLLGVLNESDFNVRFQYLEEKPETGSVLYRIMCTSERFDLLQQEDSNCNTCALVIGGADAGAGAGAGGIVSVGGRRFIVRNGHFNGLVHNDGNLEQHAIVYNNVGNAVAVISYNASRQILYRYDIDPNDIFFML